MRPFNICLILWGLPCSGKTTLAKKFIKKRPSFLLFDDPTNEQIEEIIEAGEDGYNIVITCPHLCVPENRKNAEELLRPFFSVLSFHKIGTKAEECLKRAKNNPNKKVDGLIGLYKKYTE